MEAATAIGITVFFVIGALLGLLLALSNKRESSSEAQLKLDVSPKHFFKDRKIVVVFLKEYSDFLSDFSNLVRAELITLGACVTCDTPGLVKWNEGKGESNLLSEDAFNLAGRVWYSCGDEYAHPCITCVFQFSKGDVLYATGRINAKTEAEVIIKLFQQVCTQTDIRLADDRMGMIQMEESLREQCPHCHGRGSCDCPQCGKELEESFGRVWREGICKPCTGTGKAW